MDEICLITDCKDFVNSSNNYNLDELKSLIFKYNNIKYKLDDFVMKYQTEGNCLKFYKKLFKLGYIFTEEYFYYYCNYANDISLIDWYIDNIININNINYNNLNIDNHKIIKKLISSGYNRETIDAFCFISKNNDYSICLCYYELLKHNYIFNNNYILLTIINISIQNNFNKLLNHPEIKKYFNNKENYIVTENDLLECHIKYKEPMETMISNMNDYYI